MAITVDRIEGDYAILEVGDEMVDFPVKELPKEVKEGDRLEVKIKQKEK